MLTTYRLTEQSGIMTRYVPWLAELQPALFVEIDPELAVERGIRNGEWVTVATARGEIEGRALVSGRLRPLRLGRGKRVHQVGVPYNYGPLGLRARRRGRRPRSARHGSQRVDPRGQDDDVHDPARPPRGDPRRRAHRRGGAAPRERTKFGESTARGIDMEG